MVKMAVAGKQDEPEGALFKKMRQGEGGQHDQHPRGKVQRVGKEKDEPPDQGVAGGHLDEQRLDKGQGGGGDNGVLLHRAGKLFRQALPEAPDGC